MVDGKTYAVEILGSKNKSGEPENPERADWTFAGWYDGDEEYTFGSEVKKDLTLTAKWTHNSDAHKDENVKDHKCDICGQVISQCSGGTETCTSKAVCSTCGNEYGEKSTTNHAEGCKLEWTTKNEAKHEQKWSVCDITAVSLEEHEWKNGACDECGYVRLHRVDFDANGGSAVNAATDVKWNDKVLEKAETPTYGKAGYNFAGWTCKDNLVSKDATYGDLAGSDMASITLKAKWEDVTTPTGEIKMGADSWKEFLNNITFGLFFKDVQEVVITAEDNSDEAVEIEYLLSDKELTENQLAAAKFTAYSGKFSVEPNNQYVIYAKLTDGSNNTCYINSNGIVLDNAAPAVSGIVNGETYCEAKTVTVSDSVGVASVTVNGVPVTLDAKGQFTLNPAEGKQAVVAKDQVGNVSAEMIVTVNDGHEGGTASCAKQAKCKHCDTYYGQLDGSNHTGCKHVDAVDSTVASRGNVEYWYCSDCGKYYSDEAGKNEIDESGTYTYTVTFNVGGGSFVDDKINVKWDDAVLDGVDNPVKSGRVFEGWTCGGVLVKEDVSYGDFAKSKDAASIVLDAQWRRVSGLNAQQPAEYEIEAALAKFSFMARSAKTPNNNVKVELKTDGETEKFIKDWQDRGYVVKYQFYRSTNPKYGYKKMLNKDSGTYINTMGIYGTKYYYKARVQVYDKDGKLIAQTGLKQCKYACRMWTK